MASDGHKLMAHGDLEELIPGVWMVTGSLPFPLRRNMTVVKLRDGTLLLHSVVAMNDAGMAKLDALGKPSVMIVPSTGHRLDAGFYKARYPDVRVLCPAGARAAVEKVIKADATCEEALPALGVRVHPVGAMRSAELAYEVDVAGGKALLLCDLVANRDHPPGLGGKIMASVTGGIKGRLGVPRIVKLMLVKDKASVRREIGKLAELPDLALLTVSHGRPLKDGVADALKEAAASL